MPQPLSPIVRFMSERINDMSADELRKVVEETFPEAAKDSDRLWWSRCARARVQAQKNKSNGHAVLPNVPVSPAAKAKPKPAPPPTQDPRLQTPEAKALRLAMIDAGWPLTVLVFEQVRRMRELQKPE